MKKLLMVAAVLVCGGVASVASAQSAANTTTAVKKNVSQKKTTLIPLSEARSRIDQAIKNPQVMTALMQHLSAADQKQFIADVNAAIDKLPASETERAATFVGVNRAALLGSQKGNVATLVAEIYATVPLASLAALNESLAGDLLNRATDKSVTYTDEQYIKLSKTLMDKVNARCAEADNSALRSGFAGLMMIRASNTQTPEIVNAIISELPEEAQKDAKEEWYPAALAQDQTKSYDPMLVAAEVTVAATLDEVQILPIAGPQNYESMLSDLSGASTDVLMNSNQGNPIVDAVFSTIPNALPDGVNSGAGESPAQIIEEAKGYQYQTTH